jgi:hypothetical protein
MEMARARHREIDWNRDLELEGHLDGDGEMDGDGLIEIHQVEEEKGDLEMIYGRIEMDMGVACCIG